MSKLNINYGKLQSYNGISKEKNIVSMMSAFSAVANTAGERNSNKVGVEYSIYLSNSKQAHSILTCHKKLG